MVGGGFGIAGDEVIRVIRLGLGIAADGVVPELSVCHRS